MNDMKDLDRIINNKDNLGLDIGIHVQSYNELIDLIDVLERNNFEIQIPLDEDGLRAWMLRIGEEDKYDTCFRIRNRVDDRCIAYNPSVEHWKIYCDDVLEIRDGKLVLVE